MAVFCKYSRLNILKLSLPWRGRILWWTWSCRSRRPSQRRGWSQRRCQRWWGGRRSPDISMLSYWHLTKRWKVRVGCSNLKSCSWIPQRSRSSFYTGGDVHDQKISSAQQFYLTNLALKLIQVHCIFSAKMCRFFSFVKMWFSRLFWEGAIQNTK